MLIRQIRDRGLDRWLISYLRESGRRRWRRPGEMTHLILCVADHFEPGNGRASPGLARSRVEHWVRDYPRLFGDMRDADGRPPRHTFFYPLEQYHPGDLDRLAELCGAGFGEVEVH